MLLTIVLVSCNNSTYYRIKILETGTIGVLKSAQKANFYNYRVGDTLWVRNLDNEFWTVDSSEYSTKAIVIHNLDRE